MHSNSVPDIDDKSLHYARTNVARNNLNSRIRLLKTLPTDPLIPLDALGLDQYVLSACSSPSLSLSSFPCTTSLPLLRIHLPLPPPLNPHPN